MSKWRVVALGDVTTKVGSGATPRGGKDAYRDEGIALIRSMNVLDEGFQFDGLARISAEQAGKLKHVAVETGDVLVNITGASVARCCVAPRSVLPARVNQHVAIIRLRRDQAIPRFVSAYLTSAEGKGRLLSLASGGATREALTKAMLEQFTIRLPDLATQQRVAAVLETIDELIENNRRRAAVLEEMARAIYREWFVHFRYPGRDGLHLVDSSLGPVPDSWVVQPVRHVASSVAAGPFGSKLGRKDYVVDGVPVIRGANLQVGGGFHECDFVFVTPSKADELSASVARRGDILITQRGTLGQIGLIPESSTHTRYVVSQSQMKVTVNSEVANPEFLYRQLSTPETTSRFISQAMSTGVPHVNLTLLREFEVVVPPTDLQHRFGLAVRELDRTGWALRAQADVLASLRDALLPRLVTGQIDASGLDLDALTEAATA